MVTPNGHGRWSTAEEAAKLLGGERARRSGSGWVTCCPAHDDQHPSLSLNEGSDGQLLVFCHAGCDQDAVLTALRDAGINVRASPGDASGEKCSGGIAALLRQGFKIVTAYGYTDEAGTLLYQNVRLERRGPIGDRLAKTFRLRRPNGAGWIENIKGIRRVAYKLPEVIGRAGEDVHVTEGEKDADSLTKLGLLACSIAAPGTTTLDFLRGRNVIIHEDNDPAGRDKAKRLAETLRNIAASVTVVRYADGGDGGDVSDWLGQGHPLEDLLERIEKAHTSGSWNQHAQSNGPLAPITLDNFLKLDIKPREFVVEPLFSERGLVMIFAWRGVGKTWFALGLGYAIAAGGQFLQWTTKKPRRVLHVCGEMPAADLKHRLTNIAAVGSAKPESGVYRILSADLHEYGIPDLATPAGQTAMEAVLGDAEVVIFDNVSTLFRDGDENDSKSWVPVQAWLLKLRRQGRAVIIIHHSNKSKAQRGTSKREDVLDVVLNLREPSDYEPSEGARFEVHFEKARGLSGTDAVTPFEAKLDMRDGAAIWTMRAIEDARLAEILELQGDGMSMREIAKELGMSKSAVQRAISKSGKTGAGSK